MVFRDLTEGVGVGAEGAPLVPEAPPRAVPVKLRRYRVTKQILARRAGSIHAYIGPNGSGKSLAMVRDTIPSLDAGRTVLSTVTLLDSATGLPHPNYVRLTDWRQLLDASHADVLFDEVTGIAGSREAMGMPVQVQNLLNQLRRRDLVLRWTAPSWARADTIIRSCTQKVTDCRGYWTDRRRAVGAAAEVRMWAPRRLFKLRTFATVDFDEWTASKAAQVRTGGSVKPLRAQPVEWFYGPRSRAFASYDTLDPVTRVGEVLDSGRCAHCGGRRTIPRCECP